MTTRDDGGKPPPLPLTMTEEEYAVVFRHLCKNGSDTHVDYRLMVEILDTLRAIDDKLGRLLESRGG